MNVPTNISLCVSAGLLVAVAGGMTAAVACPERDGAKECQLAPAPAASEILHVRAPSADAPVTYALHTPGSGPRAAQAPHPAHAPNPPHAIHQVHAQHAAVGQNQTTTWTFDEDGAGEDDKVVFVTSGDDGKFEVRLENGKVVTAKRNGKAIDPVRVKVKEGVVRILGGDGDTIKTFTLKPRSGGAVIGSGGAGQRVGWASGDGTFAVSPDAPAPAGWVSAGPTPPTPPVMVGINQSSVPDALRWHLRLPKDRPAVLVERVIEGLPAAEAGLKQYDVIVSIDGSEGASDATLRKVLLSKEAGDQVELYVITRGNKKKVLVELAPYDGKALGVIGSFSGNQSGNRVFEIAPHADSDFEFEFDNDFEFGDLEHELKARYQQLHELSAEHGEHSEARVHAEQALKELHATMSERVREAEEKVRAAHERGLELRGNRLVFPKELTNRWEGAGEGLEARMSELEGRLEELNSVLEHRMDAMMDRLADMMDELQEELDERDED